MTDRLAEVRAVVVRIALETAHRTQTIGPDAPQKARHQEVRPAGADIAGIEQSLAGAVAVVLDAQPAAADVALALHVTEPGADLEADALDPLALGLRERLDFQVGREVAARIAEARQPVVAFP